MLEVRFLGNFEVKYNQKQINISSRPAQALFAYLILSAGTGHRREKLAGLLWPDSLEETARENLRHALWRMRKALIAASSTRFLQADDVTISFRESSDYWLDAAELEKLNNDCSADELMNVLSNYQGELLPGFYDEWVITDREHVSSIFEHHMARLLSLLQQEGRWLDVLDWGERWIKRGQKPEPAYRALMSAHAAKGDMSKVAATYQRCAKSLKEFGVEPSKETQALYERLKAGKESPETSSTSPVKEKSEILPKTNLPIPLTSFTGREREIEEVKHLLSSARLLTLTGTGGIGKTRLAIQAAHDLLRSFKEGVWWVELAPLNDEALVPSTIAQVLGVRETPHMSLTQSIQSDLREKQILLILDNCEHLITICAQLADMLLSQCANLKILTTSREAFGITGETTLRVPALSFPVLADLSQIQNLKEFESIQLFVERASAVQPGLALAKENAFAATQICHRLDGIPLAIELAAARVKLLSLEEIAKRLDDRFTLLTHGSRTAMPRHQTLRATIDWSYDLLSVKEKTLLRRLSVFAGGWTLEGAQAICSTDDLPAIEMLDLLAHLVDKSLVMVQTENSHTRYRMLEMIRQYTNEKLLASGEAEMVGKRHVEFFVQLSEEADPKLTGPKQTVWLDRLESEHGNLRIALGWALDHNDVESAARIGTALFWFWQLRSHMSEGRLWLEQVIQLGRRLTQTESMSSQVITSFARALNHAAILANFQGDYSIGLSRSEEGLALSRRIGSKQLISQSLQALSYVMTQQENHILASELSEERLVVARELGNKLEEGRAWMQLGLLAFIQKNYSKARTYYSEGLALAREIGNKLFEAVLITNLGHVALNQQDYTTARELYTESLLILRGVGSKRHMLNALVGFAALARALGQFDSATRLSGAVEALCESIGSSLDPDDQVEHKRTLSEARAQLDDATFNRLWNEGRAMTLEQAVEFALEETS